LVGWKFVWLEADVGREDERLMRELVRKEEQLLENTFRSDADKVATIVQVGCIEFSASGGQQVYAAGQKLEGLDGVLYIVSDSVRLIDVSEDCKLLLYVAGRVSKNRRVNTNRSSLWKNFDGQWKVVFLQGTNVAEAHP